MSICSRLIFTIPLLALWGSDAFAGVVITSTSTILKENMPSQVTLYIDTDRLTIATENSITIYRGDLQKYWTVSPRLKAYSEMTPESVKQMSERMAAQVAAVQQQIAKMTPQQRQEMQAMLGPDIALPGDPRGGAAQGVAAPQNELTYTKLSGPTQTIANLPCEPYRKTTRPKVLTVELTEDLCIARISLAGLTATDFKVVDSMNTFIGPLASSLLIPSGSFANWIMVSRAAIGFEGLPLDTISYSKGAQVRHETVQKIERIDIPASTFEVPAGFTLRPSGPQPRP